MKRVLTICCLAFASTAMGFENYIITGENTITKIENKTPEIIDIRELTTIMNEKNTIIVECKKAGKGEFILTSDGKESNFTINISDNCSELKGTKDYTWYVLDTAPGVFELDPPPMKTVKNTAQPKGITSAESFELSNEENNN